jgi:arylformamidase
MTYYDLSVPLRDDLPTYPGDPGIEVSSWFSLAKGDPANVSLLHFGAHTATHIDAPAHFIEGAAKVEFLPLEVLIGEAQVVEVPAHLVSIDEAFVEAHCAPAAKRILFKTRNSAFWDEPYAGFRKDYTYLSTGAAAKLVTRGVQLIGIDYLSIEEFGQKTHQTHLTLLSNNVIIVEGLDLGDVPAGKYELICLPLKVHSGHGDGAPARVVLRTMN